MSETTEHPDRGSYQVLARRYRSRSFEELVGQEAIMRTLRNAIEHERTAHAYLFCGTRGVGKTSTARIFAHELMAHGQKMLGEPEPSQEVVDAIFRGEDIDVVEIDGASHNGVNEARELISNAGLMPARMSIKIYIIDEVHMLTQQAFNALLKTMEEPPGHVKFILCTTEPQKVPQTIQSRCQRFDFRSISDRQIADHLGSILESEEITYEDVVPLEIARLADGSMRDGLTLLDRVVAASGEHLDARTLEQVLGLPDDTLVDALVSGITTGDGGASLRAAGELVANGMSHARVLDVLAERLRRLLIAITCDGDTDLLGVTPEAAERARELAGALDSAALVHMIVACDAGSRTVRGSSASRALLDAVVVRLSLTEQFASAAGLLAEHSGKKEPARMR
jgi:DNA polymerase-3 subunit gamma/tau